MKERDVIQDVCDLLNARNGDREALKRLGMTQDQLDAWSKEADKIGFEGIVLDLSVALTSALASNDKTILETAIRAARERVEGQ